MEFLSICLIELSARVLILKKKNFQKFIELKTIIAMINSSKVKTHTSITFNKKCVASTVTTQKGSETGHQHRIHGKWKTSNLPEQKYAYNSCL
jgi:hypothetical protein